MEQLVQRFLDLTQSGGLFELVGPSVNDRVLVEVIH